MKIQKYKSTSTASINQQSPPSRPGASSSILSSIREEGKGEELRGGRSQDSPENLCAANNQISNSETETDNGRKTNKSERGRQRGSHSKERAHLHTMLISGQGLLGFVSWSAWEGGGGNQGEGRGRDTPPLILKSIICYWFMAEVNGRDDWVSIELKLMGSCYPHC